ncbi:MAG: hypothetical protein O4859_22070 [Trichodesmium sp. St18_bin1]|nr:hypothetical protein [Trichodesmium sp. St18_bin1]
MGSSSTVAMLHPIFSWWNRRFCPQLTYFFIGSISPEEIESFAGFEIN